VELNFYFDLTTPHALVKGARPQMPYWARLLSREEMGAALTEHGTPETTRYEWDFRWNAVFQYQKGANR
jgi:hypothetical protein